MRITRRFVLVAAAVATVAAACGDSTGPTSVNGRYTLRLVDGRPLPWLLVESRVTEQTSGGTATLREYVDGGTLVLLEPELDTLRIVHRAVTTPDAGAPTTTYSVEDVNYLLYGDRVCPPLTYMYRDLEEACGDRPRVPRRGDSLFVPYWPTPPASAVMLTFVREGR